jgi:hypothetical protein
MVKISNIISYNIISYPNFILVAFLTYIEATISQKAFTSLADAVEVNANFQLGLFLRCSVCGQKR